MLHVCSICDKKFVFKRELDDHLKEAHVSVAQKFERAGSILDEWIMVTTPTVDDDGPIVNEMLQRLEDHISRLRNLGYTSVVPTA